MRAKSKAPVKPLPEGWVETFTFSWNNRHIVPGTELSITGQRGRFRFVKHIKTEKTEWIEVLGGKLNVFRSFHPDKIKTVHRLTRMRRAA